MGIKTYQMYAHNLMTTDLMINSIDGYSMTTKNTIYTPFKYLQLPNYQIALLIQYHVLYIMRKVGSTNFLKRTINQFMSVHIPKDASIDFYDADGILQARWLRYYIPYN